MVLCAKKHTVFLSERSLECQAQESHPTPHSSTRHKAWESVPGTGRQSTASLLPSPSLPEKRQRAFPKGKKTQPSAGPSMTPDHRVRVTYTSERPESSTASEQSSLTEARKGALGEKEKVVKDQSIGIRTKFDWAVPKPHSKVTREGSLIPTLV